MGRTYSNSLAAFGLRRIRLAPEPPTAESGAAPTGHLEDAFSFSDFQLLFKAHPQMPLLPITLISEIQVICWLPTDIVKNLLSLSDVVKSMSDTVNEDNMYPNSSRFRLVYSIIRGRTGDDGFVSSLNGWWRQY